MQIQFSTAFMEQHGGIYTFENTVTGWFYVGQAKCFIQRHKNHMHELKHGKHYNKALQADWNRYGAAAFALDIPAYFPCEIIGTHLEVNGDTLFRLELEYFNRYEGRRYNTQKPRKTRLGWWD